MLPKALVRGSWGLGFRALGVYEFGFRVLGVPGFGFYRVSQGQLCYHLEIFERLAAAA